MDIPKDFYGDTMEKMTKSRRAPRLEDYKIPQSQDEWNSMVAKMVECGIGKKMAATMIKERKECYDKACAEFNSTKCQSK